MVYCLPYNPSILLYLWVNRAHPERLWNISKVTQQGSVWVSDLKSHVSLLGHLHLSIQYSELEAQAPVTKQEGEPV